VHNLKQRKCLRPLGEFAHAAIDMFKTDEGDEKKNAT